MYSGIFDSHAHYDDTRFDADRDELVASFNEKGVETVITIGCDLATSQNAVALTEKYPNFYASVGYHPLEAETFNEKDFDTVKGLLSHEKVVALGEIGLDYHYDYSTKECQHKVFDLQLKLAEERNIPVIIHSREATLDPLNMLKKYNCHGVVHCFSGSADTAKTLVNMGYYIGFTGVLTFDNAKKAKEACKEVPLDRLLLETDCPYMAPVPYRGKRCDSTMIAKTAEVMAMLKGVTPQEIIDITRKNAKQLFNIK